MPVSQDVNDPNFGLETDVTSPNFGLPEQKKEGGVVSGILSGLGHALNPVNLVKGALDLGGESDISKISRYGKSLLDIATGKGVDESLRQNIPEIKQQQEAAFGERGTKAAAEYWTGAGLQAALVGLPFVHGRLSKLAGVKPPEATSQVPESPMTDAAIEQEMGTPVTPETPPKPGEATIDIKSVGGEINAEQITEPTQVHGNVQQPQGAQEIAREMPAAVGSEGVQARGQGETVQETGAVAAPPPPQFPSILQSAEEGRRAEMRGPESDEATPQTPAATEPIIAEPSLKSEAPEAMGGIKAETLEQRPIETPSPGGDIPMEARTKSANEWLDNGGNINETLDEFNRTGQTSPETVDRARAYLERLQAVTDKAEDALRRSPDDPVLQGLRDEALAREQQFSDASKPLATSASAQMKGYQGNTPLTGEMAESFAGLKRKYGEISGKDFTPAQAVRAEEISTRVRKSKGNMQSATDELYRRTDTEYNRIRTTRKGPPTLDDLGKTFGQALKEVCEV